MTHRPPNRKAFPGFDLSLGPHDPAKLQGRHQSQRRPDPVPETIPSTKSKAPGATMTRLSTTTVRRRQTNNDQASNGTNQRRLVESTVDGVLVTVWNHRP